MFPDLLDIARRKARRELTPIKAAIALPLATGSEYISAKTPPITAIGLDALIPVSKRNNNKAVQLGDNAQANVKIINATNDQVMINLRPYDSERGPKTIGPTI